MCKSVLAFSFSLAVLVLSLGPSSAQSIQLSGELAPGKGDVTPASVAFSRSGTSVIFLAKQGAGTEELHAGPRDGSSAPAQTRCRRCS